MKEFHFSLIFRQHTTYFMYLHLDFIYLREVENLGTQRE